MAQEGTNDNVIDDLARKRARKKTKSQSNRLTTLDQKTQEWVETGKSSCAILFAWTARSSVLDAFFRCYGSPFNGLPEAVLLSLETLLQALVDNDHPEHDDTLKLLASRSSGGMELDKAHAEQQTALLRLLEEEQVILPFQTSQIKAAWGKLQAKAMKDGNMEPTEHKKRARNRKGKQQAHVAALAAGKENNPQTHAARQGTEGSDVDLDGELSDMEARASPLARPGQQPGLGGPPLAVLGQQQGLGAPPLAWPGQQPGLGAPTLAGPGQQPWPPPWWVRHLNFTVHNKKPIV